MKILTYERMDRTEKYVLVIIKCLALTIMTVISIFMILGFISYNMTYYFEGFVITITIMAFVSSIGLFGVWWYNKKQSLRLIYEEEK